MSSARWKQVEETFHLALELPEAERASWLDHHCGDDAALRSEVDSLLAFSGKEETAVQSAVADTAKALFEELSLFDRGKRLGPYRLLEVIGRGGLSTVYLAERADDQYKMRVAIKVVRADLGGAALLDRLRQERQILAGLDHPNIARLLDGGATDEGRPYFVMEYIEGEDLESYCAKGRLNIGQRLAIFGQLCSAVEYAHRKLVIHRDIKPGNILVTPEGIPKLLDFGIAKLLGPGPALEVSAPTLTGMQMLTPLFASPEQVRGEDLGTATDVYSLGVLLYRLLTGRHPYEPASTSPTDLARAICEARPVKPSLAVASGPIPLAKDETAADGRRRLSAPPPESPARLRRLLAGDLDTIVLKALRKEPRRRYGSAEQLAEDLDRHRRGLPVRARPDTLSYRAGKFLRRHRIAAATALGIVLLTLFYTWRLTTERDRARLEAAKAAQVVTTMIGVFQVSDPGESRGATITARELLDRGAARVRDELADQPEVRAEMLEVIGTVYRNLNLGAQARPLLEESVALRRAVASDEAGLASSLDSLGALLYDLRELPLAEEVTAEALAIRRRRLGEEHPDTLQSFGNLISIRYAQNDIEGAEKGHRDLLRLRRRVLGPDHIDVASSLHNLASVLDAQGRLEEAQDLFQQALEIKRRHHGDDHPLTAETWGNLADVQEALGKTADAEESFRRTLAIFRQVFGEESFHVAVLLRRIAKLAAIQERPREAEELLREATAIFDRLDPPEPAWRSGLRLETAEILENEGRLAAAEGLLREAVATLERELPSDLKRLGEAHSRLGDCLRRLGRGTEAEALLRAGLSELEAGVGAEDPLAQRARERLALMADRPSAES